jgi:hypothetical protein
VASLLVTAAGKLLALMAGALMARAFPQWRVAKHAGDDRSKDNFVSLAALPQEVIDPILANLSTLDILALRLTDRSLVLKTSHSFAQILSCITIACSKAGIQKLAHLIECGAAEEVKEVTLILPSLKDAEDLSPEDVEDLSLQDVRDNSKCYEWLRLRLISHLNALPELSVLRIDIRAPTTTAAPAPYGFLTTLSIIPKLLSNFELHLRVEDWDDLANACWGISGDCRVPGLSWSVPSSWYRARNERQQQHIVGASLFNATHALGENLKGIEIWSLPKYMETWGMPPYRSYLHLPIFRHVASITLTGYWIPGHEASFFIEHNMATLKTVRLEDCIARNIYWALALRQLAKCDRLQRLELHNCLTCAGELIGRPFVSMRSPSACSWTSREDVTTNLAALLSSALFDGGLVDLWAVALNQKHINLVEIWRHQVKKREAEAT